MVARTPAIGFPHALAGSRLQGRCRITADGSSLVSLLVGLALGTLLIGAAGAMHLAAQRAYRLHDAGARLQETGELAIAVLVRHARIAGFSELTATLSTLQPFALRFLVPAVIGCSSGTLPSSASTSAAECVPDTSGNDALLLRHQALPDPTDPFSGLPGYGAASGEGADCLGQNPDASGTPVAANLFRVSAESLACEGNGNLGRPQPMFPGIEQLRFRYALDTDADGVADLYARAGEPPLASAGDWERVRAIEICLVVRAAEPIAGLSPQRWIDCEDNGRTIADGRLRRVVRTLVALANRDPLRAMVRDGAVP